VRLLSSSNTTYNRDYQAEAPDGSQLPVATVFARRGERIHHIWSSELLFAPQGSRSAPAPRRLHVAPLGRARLHTRGSRRRLASSTPVQLIPYPLEDGRP
jgi:hypothetical protein